MQITTGAVKELREKTGAGVMDCRRALEEAAGSIDRAVEILRTQGLSRAEKRSGRVAQQGVIDCYIHAGGRIGVMVEVNCETDFVARTDAFKALVHDIAMQVAATGPKFVTPDDVPADETAQASELALLSQPFIKNPSQTIQDLINDSMARTGEAIRVRRFVRYELGE